MFRHVSVIGYRRVMDSWIDRAMWWYSQQIKYALCMYCAVKSVQNKDKIDKIDKNKIELKKYVWIIKVTHGKSASDDANNRTGCSNLKLSPNLTGGGRCLLAPTAVHVDGNKATRRHSSAVVHWCPRQCRNRHGNYVRIKRVYLALADVPQSHASQTKQLTAHNERTVAQTSQTHTAKWSDDRFYPGA